jgi:hypothetical protein
MEREDRDES